MPVVVFEPVGERAGRATGSTGSAALLRELAGAQAPLPPPARRAPPGGRPRPDREPHDRRPRRSSRAGSSRARRRSSSSGARRLCEEAAPASFTVAVTSPLNVLRELFTVKGAGTLLRRGARIVRHDGWDGVDVPRVRELLASSFGRAAGRGLLRADARAASTSTRATAAASILADAPLGAYLTKFAVSAEAQGEGIARDLWEALVADTPVVFWRARRTNPISEWYAKLCDGLMRVPDWTVYWKGLAPDVDPRRDRLGGRPARRHPARRGLRAPAPWPGPEWAQNHQRGPMRRSVSRREGPPALEMTAKGTLRRTAKKAKRPPVTFQFQDACRHGEALTISEAREASGCPRREAQTPLLRPDRPPKKAGKR